MEYIFVNEKTKLLSEAKRLYKNDTDFRDNYDYIQRKFRCCGFENAINDFNQIILPNQKEQVLKACCIPNDDNKIECEKEDFEGIENNEYFEKIHNEGCFNVVKRKFRNSLPKMLITGSIGMAVTAIIGIVNVALALAFVAQLNRKKRNWDIEPTPTQNWDIEPTPTPTPTPLPKNQVEMNEI